MSELNSSGIFQEIAYVSESGLPLGPEFVGTAFGYTVKLYVEGGIYSEDKLLLVDADNNVLYRVATLVRPWTADTIVNDVASGDIEVFTGSELPANVAKTDVNNRFSQKQEIATGLPRIYITDTNNPAGNGQTGGVQWWANNGDTNLPEDYEHCGFIGFGSNLNTNLNLYNVYDPTDGVTIDDNVVFHEGNFAISKANATDLTDGGDSTLHFHASDRARANHTGTQAISTVTGLQSSLDGKVPKNPPTSLTDSTNVAIDCGSDDNKIFTHSSSNATTTYTISNISDGDTHQVLISPQSAVTFTYTFVSAGLTCLVAGAGGANLEIAAESGKKYRVFFTRVGSDLIVSQDSRAY